MNVEALAAKAAVLKNTIRGLTSERQRLAPIAVNGHDKGPEARARIAAIDAERQQAVSDLETVEDAMRAPVAFDDLTRAERNQLRRDARAQKPIADAERLAALLVKHASLVARLEAIAERRLSRWKGALASQVAEAYFMLGRPENDLNIVNPNTGERTTLDQLPRMYAAHLTGETEWVKELNGLKEPSPFGVDNTDRIGELTVKVEIPEAAHRRIAGEHRATANSESTGRQACQARRDGTAARSRHQEPG